MSLFIASQKTVKKEIELGHALFELEELKEKTGVPRCVVCMDATANMSFVHGNTAHLACCEACAKKWKNVVYDSDTDDDDVPNTNEKCPVCRQRIKLIVKQF